MSTVFRENFDLLFELASACERLFASIDAEGKALEFDDAGMRQIVERITFAHASGGVILPDLQFELGLKLATALPTCTAAWDETCAECAARDEEECQDCEAHDDAERKRLSDLQELLHKSIDRAFEPKSPPTVMPPATASALQ